MSETKILEQRIGQLDILGRVDEMIMTEDEEIKDPDKWQDRVRLIWYYLIRLPWMLWDMKR